MRQAVGKSHPPLKFKPKNPSGSVPDFRQTLKVFETFRVYPKIWDAPNPSPLKYRVISKGLSKFLVMRSLAPNECDKRAPGPTLLKLAIILGRALYQKPACIITSPGL
jgi:hypothetical protein